MVYNAVAVGQWQLNRGLSRWKNPFDRAFDSNFSFSSQVDAISILNLGHALVSNFCDELKPVQSTLVQYKHSASSTVFIVCNFNSRLLLKQVHCFYLNMT
jgi:hypothetical protein